MVVPEVTQRGRPLRNLHSITEPAAEEHLVPQVEVQPLFVAVVRRRGRPQRNMHPLAVQPVAEEHPVPQV